MVEKEKKNATVGSIQQLLGLKKMVNMNTTPSPCHVVLGGLAKKFLALLNAMFICTT